MPARERSVGLNLHTDAWIRPSKGKGQDPNPNRNPPSDLMETDTKGKKKKVSVGYQKYTLDDAYKSSDENVNILNRELVASYNEIAERRVEVIQMRAHPDPNAHPGQADKTIAKIRNLVNDALNLMQRVREAGGRPVPMPKHFKNDP